MQLVKEASEASLFKYNKEYEEVMKTLLNKGKAVIGHNRKKTVGVIDDASAHPFCINDRYLFVHNGTLGNTFSLEKELHSHVKLNSNVDSEVLGNLLCPHSQDKTALEEILGKVAGAYACVWIDQKEEKLYMLRNKERPLFLAETSNGYFWASEPGFLYAVCSRNRLKIETCEQIKEDVLYSIDLTTHALKMTEETLSIKKALPVSHMGTGQQIGRASNKVHTFSQNGKISKNAFKRFSKNWLGSIGSFYIDDYVERTIGDWQSGYHIWGEDDKSYDLPHIARGVLPPMRESEMILKYAGNLVYGRISRIIQNTETGAPEMIFDFISLTRNGVTLKERIHEEKVH